MIFGILHHPNTSIECKKAPPFSWVKTHLLTSLTTMTTCSCARGGSHGTRSRVHNLGKDLTSHGRCASAAENWWTLDIGEKIWKFRSWKSFFLSRFSIQDLHRDRGWVYHAVSLSGNKTCIFVCGLTIGVSFFQLPDLQENMWSNTSRWGLGPSDPENPKIWSMPVNSCVFFFRQGVLGRNHISQLRRLFSFSQQPYWSHQFFI